MSDVRLYNKKQGYNILFLWGVPRGNIGRIFRVQHVAEALMENGWSAVCLETGDPGVENALGKCDAVVLFRSKWDARIARVHEMCIRRKIPLIYDIDDLLFDPEIFVSPLVPLQGLSFGERKQQWIEISALYRTTLEHCSAALLSTKPLARAAAALCREVHVLPSTLSKTMLDTAASIGRTHSPSTAGGKIRLGYTSGTPTHQRDFAAVTPALAGALSAYPESILVIVGQLDIGSFTALEPYAERIEIRPIVPMDDLFGEIRRFDINLAPLEAGNPFCEAKSELRCILAGALGIPTIATATIPMQDAITDGENGILVSDPDMWPVALDRLLAHPDRIRSLGNAAAMNAKSRYGPEACFEKAETIFSKIIET